MVMVEIPVIHLSVKAVDERPPQGICSTTFIAALLIIARTWKQMRLSRRMEEDSLVHFHNGALLSREKKKKKQ